MPRRCKKLPQSRFKTLTSSSRVLCSFLPRLQLVILLHERLCYPALAPILCLITSLSPSTDRGAVESSKLSALEVPDVELGRRQGAGRGGGRPIESPLQFLFSILALAALLPSEGGGQSGTCGNFNELTFQFMW